MLVELLLCQPFQPTIPLCTLQKLNLRGRKVCDGVVFSPYAGFVNDLSIFYPIEQQAL